MIHRAQFAILLATCLSAAMVEADTRAATSFVMEIDPVALTTVEPVRFKGSVTSPLPDPTGTVLLYIDDVLRASVAAPDFDIIAGTQSEGMHPARLEYSGDATHLPKVQHFEIYVQKPEIAMNVTMDPPGGATAGSPITITITFPEEPELSGTVRVQGAEETLFYLPISGGVATLTTTLLPPGPRIFVYIPGTATWRPTFRMLEYVITDAPLPSAPTAFYVMAPCRVLDTRVLQSMLPPRVTYPFGVARRCEIPNGAKAVAVNLTVVAPANWGHLSLFPGADPLPLASTLNYRPRKTRANSAVLGLSAGGKLALYNNGPAAVHVVVDVTGYFQ